MLGNGELEAIPGDRITAFYEDPQGDYGDLEFAREVALYTRTVVPGGVIGTTIWDVEGSPYLVTGDLTVSSGASLIIEAGVEVLFLANSDDQSGGQRLSDAELIVKGALVVEGTEAAPVVFGSSEANARAGDWGGIRVEGGSLSLAYAHLSHSGYGISADGLSGSGFVMDHSVITASGQGIYLGSASTRAIVLTNNVIEVSSGWAVKLYQEWWNTSSPVTEVTGNTVTSTNGNGVLLSGHFGGLNLVSNVVRSTGTGIHIESVGGATTIASNDVVNVRDYPDGVGIYTYYRGDATPNAAVLVEGNHVEGFSDGMSIYFEGGDSHSGDVGITANEFLGNRTGLSVKNAVSLTVTDNVVTNTGSNKGIYVSGSTVSMFSGNVVTSSNQGIYLDSSTVLAFSGNEATGNLTGVRLNNSGVAGFTGNVISNNSSVGLYVAHSNAELSESFLLEGNDLSGNGTGIELHNYANVVVTGNDLSGSSQYGIANYTSNEIDARYNYWGESETTFLSEGGHPKGLGFIYDGRDEGSYGAVNYAGWLLEAGGEPSGVTVAGAAQLSRRLRCCHDDVPGW